MLERFYKIDMKDLLMGGIRKLRQEDASILQENNISIRGTRGEVYSEKFALIFQKPICMFIEN